MPMGTQTASTMAEVIPALRALYRLCAKSHKVDKIILNLYKRQFLLTIFPPLKKVCVGFTWFVNGCYALATVLAKFSKDVLTLIINSIVSSILRIPFCEHYKNTQL